jgi:FMN-dependent oxidoreductase (nitrilotriacetate monooxygenase family)
MRLMAGLETGPTMNHVGTWRHPDTDNAFLTPDGWEHIARVLEAGCFDGVFLADTMGLPDNFPGLYDTLLRHGGQLDLLDPMVIGTLMARVTRRLGIGVTLSTTLLNPFHIARMLATLDLMSGGRVAWNVVTTSNPAGARNFGLSGLPPKEERYDRADEVLEACFSLWDTWDDDAVRFDKQAGVFIDPDKIRRSDYAGKWVSTRGPLNVPPSAQRRPVIMQAGASDRGREFAARWAEVIFTIQHDIGTMRAFYDDVKARMRSYGRPVDELAILASVDVVVGETEEIARARQEFVNGLVTFEVAAAVVAKHTGLDVTKYDLDKPLDELTQAPGSHGTLKMLVDAGSRAGMTLRDAVIRYGISGLTPQIVGTAASVADQLEELFVARGCDGFIISQTNSPGGYEQFVRGVVPELQRRGLFRSSYGHDTLRATLRTAA